MFKITRLIRPSYHSICQQIAKVSNVTGDRFKGKVAVMTGASDGIGLAAARCVGQGGASVIISSRKQDNVDRAVETLSKEGLDVIGTVCHVYKEEDRKHLFDFAVEKRGGVDIFVSNAGVNPYFGSLLDIGESAWDKIFDTNVKAPLLLTKLAVPLMKKRGGGAIVYLSSYGAYQTVPMLSPYCISKTALVGLSRAVAVEVGPNIRANCVCPGIIETRFADILTTNEEAAKYYLSSNILKRFGQSHEVGKLIAFLCSDDSSYITGESFVIAGGGFTRL